MAIDQITSSVAFQDAQGVVLANGLLTLDLSQDAKITTNGQVAPRRVYVTLDATGKIPANTNLWGNDQLSPSGTLYTARVYDQKNNLVYGPQSWSISGTSPIDVSTLTPMAGGASFPSPITSVALTMPPEFSVAGSPLTANGTLAVTKANETANTFWAGPTTGAAAAPNFRAMVAADVVVGSGMTGTVPTANGGTAQNSTATFPTSGVVVTEAASETLTNKTLTSPVINGTPTGTGIPTATLKTGSGAGNYTTASTAYVRVDSTNLAYTASIPTGWKLLIHASGTFGMATATANANAALADGVANNTGILAECTASVVNAQFQGFNLNWIITGDGASHTINLQFKTGNAADSAAIVNSNSSALPTMTFLLTPSN